MQEIAQEKLIYNSRNYMAFIALRGFLYTLVCIYNSRNYMAFIAFGMYKFSSWIYNSRNYMAFIAPYVDDDVSPLSTIVEIIWLL